MTVRSALGMLGIIIGVPVMVVTAAPHLARSPDLYCLQYKDYPEGHEYSNGETPDGEPSLWPLGVSCTYETLDGDSVVVHDDLQKSFFGYAGIVLTLGGTLCFAKRPRPA